MSYRSELRGKGVTEKVVLEDLIRHKRIKIRMETQSGEFMGEATPQSLDEFLTIGYPICESIASRFTGCPGHSRDTEQPK